MSARRFGLESRSIFEALDVRRFLSTASLVNFNMLAANAGHSLNDSAYDGHVDLSDFNRLAGNFGLSDGPDSRTPEDWAAAARQGIWGGAGWDVSDRGVLVITGSLSHDHIRLTANDLQRIQNEYAKTRIRRIHIDAGAGDDVVEMLINVPVTIYGDDGNDTIRGGKRSDYIDGGNGYDTIRGGLGDDTLHGGHGSDILCGDVGSDIMYGGTGNDRFKAADGAFDRIFAGRGNDRLISSDSNDEFVSS